MIPFSIPPLMAVYQGYVHQYEVLIIAPEVPYALGQDGDLQEPRTVGRINGGLLSPRDQLEGHPVQTELADGV